MEPQRVNDDWGLGGLHGGYPQGRTDPCSSVQGAEAPPLLHEPTSPEGLHSHDSVCKAAAERAAIVEALLPRNFRAPQNPDNNVCYETGPELSSGAENTTKHAQRNEPELGPEKTVCKDPHVSTIAPVLGQKGSPYLSGTRSS
jgi:hypothetical protein